MGKKSYAISRVRSPDTRMILDALLIKAKNGDVDSIKQLADFGVVFNMPSNVASESRAKTQSYNRDYYAKRKQDTAWMEKRLAAQREYRAAFHSARSPEERLRHADRTRARRFGITVDELLARESAADGVCEICGNPQVPSCAKHSGRLCFDHDHATGRLRGMLCTPCNIALGYYESGTPFEKFGSYLKKYSQNC